MITEHLGVLAAHNSMFMFYAGSIFTDVAKASANICSLIETAKANGLEPSYYLRYVFKELPKAETLDQIEALLHKLASSISLLFGILSKSRFNFRKGAQFHDSHETCQSRAVY